MLFYTTCYLIYLTITVTALAPSPSSSSSHILKKTPHSNTMQSITTTADSNTLLNSIVGNVHAFLDTAIAISMSKYKIDLLNKTVFKNIDHVCYRCKTIDEYHSIKSSLLVDNKIGDVLVEGIIGGRMICTVRLHHPIKYRHFNIHCIEIPSPKEGTCMPYCTSYYTCVHSLSFFLTNNIIHTCI